MKINILLSELRFETKEAAMAYMQRQQDKSMTVGSVDPLVSCVDVPALPWVRKVFASSEYPGRRTVKGVELKQ